MVEFEMEDAWGDVFAWEDPATAVLEEFLRRVGDAPDPVPTGVDATGYLDLIAGNVDFFERHQDECGAIIDPYREEEYQYATPCYAHAAATLVKHAGRDDLLESAAPAMDWSVRSLARREAATAHEDFYAPVLAHALTLFEGLVESSRLEGFYKRAARLALQSLRRWQRPSGELWIVKNRNDPAERHGYEGYSSHSQYNLLAMSMLAIAYRHSLHTEEVPERVTPAETGGFIIDLRPGLGYLFANAGGMYVQLAPRADHRHNPTGLLRVHRAGHYPQLGPSDGTVADPISRFPEGPRTLAAIGAAWRNDGGWHRLAEQPADRIHSAEVERGETSARKTSFEIEYRGDFPGVERIVESYELTPERVMLTVELPGYEGPVRLVWPVLADDGERETGIEQNGNALTVSLEGTRQTFYVPDADDLSLGDELHAYRNGWARLARADTRGGRPATLEIRPERTP